MFSKKASLDNPYCSKCKGVCLRKTSAETQKAAREMFVITPNACIGNLSGQNTRCPYK